MAVQRKVEEYDILRVIATLLVLIGHCGYYHILTPYGQCDYSYLAENISILYKLFLYIVKVIYEFHMPLFMALSGAVFKLNQDKSSNQTFAQHTNKKARRLMVPFFIVSLCYAVPLKYVSGYFSSSEHFIRDILVGQIMIQGNTHLWYLPVLFIIFLIAFFVQPIFEKHFVFLLILMAIINCISVMIEIIALQLVMRYILWFFAGYLFEKYRKKLNGMIRGWYVPVLLFFLLGFSAIQLFVQKYEMNILASVLMIPSACCGCALAYCVSWLCFKYTKVTKLKSYQIMSRDTFGCYLYSDALNYPILAAFANMFQTRMFTDHTLVVLLILTRLTVTLIVSVVIAELFRKLKCRYII